MNALDNKFLDFEKKSNGTVSYSNDVLISIAETAAREIEGVTSLKISELEIEEIRVRIKTSIILEYGLALVEKARQVQDVIKNMLDIMTGLEVVSVNVTIAALNIGE